MFEALFLLHSHNNFNIFTLHSMSNLNSKNLPLTLKTKFCNTFYNMKAMFDIFNIFELYKNSLLKCL